HLLRLCRRRAAGCCPRAGRDGDQGAVTLLKHRGRFKTSRLAQRVGAGALRSAAALGWRGAGARAPQVEHLGDVVVVLLGLARVLVGLRARATLAVLAAAEATGRLRPPAVDGPGAHGHERLRRLNVLLD